MLLIFGAQALEGDAGAALATAREAVRALEASETMAYAHAARYALGGLVGGDEGAALRKTAEDWATAQGAKNPQRLLAMLLPDVAVAGR